jgi:hypothetical protein
MHWIIGFCALAMLSDYDLLRGIPVKQIRDTASHPVSRVVPAFEREPKEIDLGMASARNFSLKSTARDASSHATFERDDEKICQPSAEIAFDVDPIKQFLKTQNLYVAFQSVRSTQLLLVTEPRSDASANQASYYMVLVSLERCDEQGSVRSCSLRASAVQKIAPIENNILKVSAAKSVDDQISASLAELASDKTVSEATFWCSLKAAVQDKIKSIEY